MKLLNSIVPALISGLAIGWIVGMSLSPVVSAVLSTLLGVLISVILVASGFTINGVTKSPESSSGSLWGIASFVIALAFSGTKAVDFRLDRQQAKIRSDVNFWKGLISEKDSTGSVHLDLVVSKAFEHHYGNLKPTSTTEQPNQSYRNTQDFGFNAEDFPEIQSVAEQSEILELRIHDGKPIDESILNSYPEFLIGIWQNQILTDEEKEMLFKHISLLKNLK